MAKLGYPFTLGVASGEPLPDGMIIWTRLAPDPLSRTPDRPGGMPDESVLVRWQVAEDEAFTRIVAEGRTRATQDWAHSVHVRVTGLRPGTEYFYRFGVAEPFENTASPVGRTKTAPARDAETPVRFAFTSCQRYEHGYYTALRHLAAERPDLIVHLGDYIYEYGRPARPALGRYVRKLEPPEAEAKTLQAYRNRFARIKMDPDLRAAHAAAPWVTIWDDHEVKDNYRGKLPGDGSNQAAFLRRRTAAYRAYYEHLPLRVRPSGDGLQMYRWRPYGTVADFHLLDSRQYRTDDSMLGADQERWLIDRLRDSQARWRVLAEPLFFSRRRFPGSPPTLSSDAWDAFPAQRGRILDAAREAGTPNLIVISGDVHNHWAAEVLADFDKPDAPSLGVELVSSSVTSMPAAVDADAVMRLNPHIKFFDGHRGYVVCEASRESFTAEFRIVDFVDRKDAPVRTVARFTVEEGRLKRADV
ncbi:alkaline phosphatase D family protein [Thermopolyspora sp. NPDC052614]|uniref:alkaline phosphatase D family protein n=1 Tax=Thermopolyspora sp. NPDC052614 TaxID=3155682 RepID=UPI00341F0EE5